jgi:hypothetical protein
MSGYDKHPDYGGPPVTRWAYVKGALMIAALMGVGLWLGLHG